MTQLATNRIQSWDHHQAVKALLGLRGFLVSSQLSLNRACTMMPHSAKLCSAADTSCIKTQLPLVQHSDGRLSAITQQ